MNKNFSTDVVVLNKLYSEINDFGDDLAETDVRNYRDFASNRIVRRASTQFIITVYELYKRLTPESQKALTIISDKRIMRTRNISSHDYDAVDFSIVWGSLTRLMGNPCLKEIKDRMKYCKENAR